jgi:ribosomal protein L37E
MEEGKKKVMMAVIVVACFIAAGAIVWVSTKDTDAIHSGDEMIWLKCRNPECEHTWQMDLRKYLDFKNEQIKAKGHGIYPITCPKCGEESGYEAMKCPECGFIFERGSVPNDLPDRCPECGYSETEARRRR